MIQQGSIQNCPVTLEVVKHADIIIGKDVGLLKGKTVRKVLEPVVSDYVHVPPELMEIHKEVTIAVNIMFVNKQPFLTSISKHIKFTTVKKLGSRAAKNILKSIKNIIKLYS
eukprot:7249793-Ditylum_brightwellii.AAC.1